MDKVLNKEELKKFLQKITLNYGKIIEGDSVVGLGNKKVIQLVFTTDTLEDAEYFLNYTLNKLEKKE